MPFFETLQFRESHSYTTVSENQNMASSPTSSSSSSTPSEYEELHAYLANHTRIVVESLGDLAIISSPSPSSPPFSPTMPFSRVFIANSDPCQRHLTWDHLPNDFWSDNLDQWIETTIQKPLEVHPATNPIPPVEISRQSSSSTWTSAWPRKFPSFELPPPDLPTNIPQEVPEAYSPSEYSQDDFDFSIAARTLLTNAPARYISAAALMAIIPQTQAVCAELRARVNHAEDSGEWDSENDSDVSWLDLDEAPVLGLERCYMLLARGRRSVGADIGSGGSDLRVRRHHIGPGIAERIAGLANSGWGG